MKIIQIDNFAREHVADYLIADNVDRYHGSIIIYHLNEKLSGNTSPNYFILVEDNYKLNKGMEDLI